MRHDGLKDATTHEHAAELFNEKINVRDVFHEMRRENASNGAIRYAGENVEDVAHQVDVIVIDQINADVLGAPFPDSTPEVKLGAGDAREHIMLVDDFGHRNCLAARRRPK